MPISPLAHPFAADDRRYDYVATPIGRLLIAGHDRALTHVCFDDARRDAVILPGWSRRPAAVLNQARRELAEYFAGRRRTFETPLDPAGTVFQFSVWQALTTIPFGETASYAEIAARIGSAAGAARAVGAANGANPIPIFIPCHRVVGTDRSLTGFGGGLALKRWLLDHEGALAHPQSSLDFGGGEVQRSGYSASSARVTPLVQPKPS